MSVDVRVPTILRSFTGGQKAVQGTGDTLADLLTDDGSLHRFVNIYINDEDVRFQGGLDAKLNSGDEVTILPAVAGGAFAFAAAHALRG